MRTLFAYFLQAIRDYKWYYVVMALAPLLGACYKPVNYYAIKLVLDTLTAIDGFDWQQLFIPISIFIGAELGLIFIWRFAQFLEWHAEPYVRRGVLVSALQKILRFRYVFFQNTPAGSITSKTKGLVDGYDNFWRGIYFNLSFWVFGSIAALLSIFLVNIKLGLFILIWGGVFLLINYFLAKKINYLSHLESEAKHDGLGALADAIGNASSIKLFANNDHEIKRFNQNLSDKYVPLEIRRNKYAFKINCFNDIMSIIVMLSTIFYMLKLKQLGEVSIGDFVFVYTMVFQLSEALWHLVEMFQEFSVKMGDFTASLALISKEKPEMQSPLYDTIDIINSPIEFRDISFKYDKNQIVFKNFNLKIKSGEKIGLVGHTGAGKTTLINLLLKIYNPQSGSILINNQDISAIDNDVIRKQVALIPQDINLFHRNLLENIRYGNIDATDEEVIEASKRANAHEFISQLPLGYNTMVGERGVKLSGGQRQRIAIARAILKNAPILILDEATSALDSITEKSIQQSISNLINGKTVLAIAHRLSTLKDMDRIVVIENGAIVAQGSHDELLQDVNGLYHKIWYTQYMKI